MSLRTFLWIAQRMRRVETGHGREKFADETLSFCRFAPAAYDEAERGGEQARLWKMQQSVWTWAQLRVGSDADRAGGFRDGDDREFERSRPIRAAGSD